MARSFGDKFLRKIKKVDSDQLETFLAQVLREKAFLEVVFNSITEGILVVDGKQKIFFANEAAGSLLNFDIDAAHGRPLDKLFRNRDLLDLLQEFRDAGMPIRRRELTLRAPSPRLFSVSIIPVEDTNGLATHSVWIVGDRTDSQRAAEEKQRIANIESLATLTAGVAHEIKNPLNSLGIHAQLVSKAVSEIPRDAMARVAFERIEKSASVIIDEIGRIARIVDGFIRAVRPVKPYLRKASINFIIDSVSQLLAPDCAERGITLTLDLDSEIPQLFMDREQIQQALLNVLKNAVESIETDEGLISIRTSLKSDHALIEIEDNGCGIPDADRLRIFEPYHSTKFHGTGLGLMMVYRIVKAHHGAIALSSEEGAGTIFSIALPLDERPVRLLAAQVEPPLGHLDEVD